MNRRGVLGPLLWGGVVLGLGLWLAIRTLPEWRPPPRADSALVRIAGAEMEAAGAHLRSAKVQLGSSPFSGAYDRAFRLLGPAAADYLYERSDAVARCVEGTLEVPGVASGGVTLAFDAGGRLRGLEWWPAGAPFRPAQASEAEREARRAFVARLEERLRGPDAFVGADATPPPVEGPILRRPLAPRAGAPAEAVVRLDNPNSTLQVYRTLHDPSRAAETPLRLTKIVPALLLVLLVGVLFLVLLVRRRIGPRIAYGVAALALISLSVGGIGSEHAYGGVFTYTMLVLYHLFLVVYLAVLWMVAESLLRNTVAGFTTSLDAIGYGRLGPRAGRAILAGLGMGAFIAGLRLLGSALAARLAGASVHPTGGAFPIPPFSDNRSPLFEGAFLAALLVLGIALLRGVMQKQRAEVLAAVLFALYTSLWAPVAPWGAAFALTLGVATALLFVFQRYGLASLLVAAMSAALLRDTLAAVRLAPHALAALLAGTLSLLALAIAGAVAIRRPEREEEGRIEAPEYLRRIENEHRVKHEMDLLSRMQLALLPEKPPAVPGLDLAVRTVLATEAGGDLYDFVVEPTGALWIAAGDVSGHGYSCGIQHAMVKAAFMSLARDGRTPAQVLMEIERVLRSAGKTRLFTSLTLLRIDPATGRGLLANAGHPYPLLLENGSCREIPAPGLPLGQGPPRRYEDQPIELAPGAILVIASDGLYEGTDRFDAQYGFDRPSQVLTSVGLFRRPAEAILEAITADWRLHVGDGPPSDDTTVVVVKRPNLFA